MECICDLLRAGLQEGKEILTYIWVLCPRALHVYRAMGNLNI